MNESIAEGTRLRLVKGCKARGLDKGITVRVVGITPLGAEYSHAVKVTFRPVNGFSAGKTFGFYVRHANRLTDPVVRLNDGNPTHTIEVTRV